jgi:hypothetical protein
MQQSGLLVISHVTILLDSDEQVRGVRQVF